jgi:hypothetical protein
MRQRFMRQTELVLLPSGCSSKFQFRLFTKPPTPARTRFQPLGGVVDSDMRNR